MEYMVFLSDCFHFRGVSGSLTTCVFTTEYRLNANVLKISLNEIVETAVTSAYLS